MRHQQGTEQVRLVVAEFAFRQVGDKQSLVVHDEGDADPVLYLAENVANDRTGEELTKFVLDRRDGFASEPRVVIGVFALPERANVRIFDLSDNPRAIGVIGEQSVYAKQGRAVAFQKGRDGVIEDVFEARSP